MSRNSRMSEKVTKRRFLAFSKSGEHIESEVPRDLPITFYYVAEMSCLWDGGRVRAALEWFLTTKLSPTGRKIPRRKEKHRKSAKLPWHHNFKLSFWSLHFVFLDVFPERKRILCTIVCIYVFPYFAKQENLVCDIRCRLLAAQNFSQLACHDMRSEEEGKTQQ